MSFAMHSFLVTVCALAGFGLAQTLEPDSGTESDPPQLTIKLSKTDVKLIGSVSSVAHDSILRQRVLALFPDKMRTFDLQEQPALPPGWALVTEVTLLAIAETFSSTTEIDPSGILVSGITTDSTKWRAGVARIEKNLLPGMRLQHRVVEITSIGSHYRQCIALFRTAMRGRTIEFPRSSATLNTSAAPLLDELIHIAADCPAARITITGHTDNTGDESANKSLSRKRADAVAAYMIANGIAEQRIVADGAGSSRPLVAGETARAQPLNRRIDIEIDFPDS